MKKNVSTDPSNITGKKASSNQQGSTFSDSKAAEAK